MLIQIWFLLLAACNNPLEDSAIPSGCAARAAFYPDADGDGAGSNLDVYIGCAAPTGYVTAAGDCDDADAAVQIGCDTGADTGDTGADTGTDTGADTGDTGA